MLSCKPDDPPLPQASCVIGAPPGGCVGVCTYTETRVCFCLALPVQVWSAIVDGALTTTSLNNKGTAVLLLKQVTCLDDKSDDQRRNVPTENGRDSLGGTIQQPSLKVLCCRSARAVKHLKLWNEANPCPAKL